MSFYNSVMDYFFPSPPEPTYDPPLATPKYKLGTEPDANLKYTLADGRVLSYAQYGAPNGKPIFYLHGLPGSRLEAARMDGLATEMGARLIAAERPGYGWSTPDEKRRDLRDHSRDLMALGEHLGLQQYSVIGGSGGGPYVLACADAMPADKLKAASIVCGVGPPDIGWQGAGWPTRLGFTYGYLYTPWLVKKFFERQPHGRLDLTDEERLAMMRKQGWGNTSKLHPKDAELLKDTEMLRLLLRGNREAYRQGAWPAVLDGQLMCRGWGFRVEDIRKDLPVYLWYGKHDEVVPLNHGVQVAKRLGDRAKLHIEDETHASIGVYMQREMLAELLQHM